MAVADDLLRLSEQLLRTGFENTEQIWFRKSVSATYYALFHLLVDEATAHWNGSPDIQLGLQRAFEHKRMREISLMARNGPWRYWGRNQASFPQELSEVANTFVLLQEARHLADYDNAMTWSAIDVEKKLKAARKAFLDWRSIKDHPAANEYLLALLVGKKRE